MYGQGNYAPQFRHGPPPPLQQPPPFHQPPPGPPHSMTHQPPLGPPPPSYQHALLAPAPPPQQHVHQPPPASVNMGQPYSHLPHPIRGSAPMVHAYAQPIPSHPRQPIPPPPRMLPLPPLPSHSQGQVLYRTPAPPPFGIQHAPAPPPPPVSSSFVSVTPAPFVSYGQAPAVDAYPPSLPPPPPPPPPSSPPPLPPSPPPPVSPMLGFADVVPMAPSGSSAEHDVAGDGEKGGDGDSGEGGNLEDKIQAQVDLSSPPPKPVEEVVRNIEVLCQFMAKVGPHFEDMARAKEAGNPQFDFLFGGDAGSDAAIGHEYFLWMKRKTLCEMESSKKQDHKFPSSTTLKSKGSLESDDVDDEFAPVSPAVSDMDMEDDMDKGFDKLNEESAGDFASLSREIHVTRGPLHESQSTAVRLVSEVAESGTVSCLGPASMPTSEDIKDSSFIEDISPVRASHDAVEHAVDSNVHGSVRTLSGDSSLIKGSPTAASGKSDEIPRFFVKDGSPFRLIQGYASDDSEEDDTKESVEINIPVASPTATTSASGLHQDMSVTQASSPSDKRKDDKVPPCNPAQNTDVLEDGSIHADHQIGKHHQEDTRLDSAMQDVDEFGRLVRKGTSDSDSDQMYPNRRPVKRGRSRSRSRSPQGSRRRRRSRSPRRRDNRSRSRSWSPKRSRSRSPSAFRRANMFARRDRDQRPDCFNFYRGRCFRGASCRYLHRDFTRHMSRQQQYQDFQDSGKYDGHDAALLLDHKTATVTEMEDEKCEKFLQEEVRNSEVPASMEPSRASIIIADTGGLDEKDAFSTVKNDAGDLQDVEQVSQEVNNMMKTERENANLVEEERTQVLVESSQLTLADSTPVQPSPARETQSTRETLLGKPSTSEDLSSQDSQSTPHTATLELQNVTQLSHAEGSVHPLPAQTTQLAVFQSEGPIAQPYNVHDPATQIHSTQGHIISSYSNYVPPDQPLLPSEFPLHSFSAPQETPPLPPPDHTNAPLVPQQSRENLLLPATSYQSHPPPPHMFPSYRPIDTDYHSHGVPQNPNWSNIPRPPPPSHVNTLLGRPPFPPTEFPLPQHQQNAMPPASDFSLLRGPYPPGEVGRPQEIVFHPRPFQSVESSHQTAGHMDEFRNRPLPMGNQQNHPFVREDRFSQAAMPAGPQMMFDPQREYHLRNPSSHPEDAPIPLTGQGFSSSNPFAQVGAMQPPPLPNRMQPFSREEFPPPVRDLSYSHHLPYGQQHPNFPSNMGTTSTAESAVQRYSSSFPGNKPPYASDTGLLKMPVVTHYNPFASTFEQSTTSLKFGSGDSGREGDVGYSSKYDSSFPSGHVTVDGHQSRAVGYAHETSAEMLAGVQKQVARESVAGDAYDPLFDSIEPSSSAVKKLDHVGEQDPVVDNAGTKSKLSSLRRLVDVEETSGRKGEPGVELKSEVDEFGEVATDAEAGVVENDSPQLDGKDWSPGVAVDAAAAGEVEIDQVKSPGKNKKSKDSRSMKLFKIALADFVKEVLKPSWRQGNMSKEAFKTIVKKTVDKVSGAMPSHQIPKSQVKINQYVESSQRKLTKLVMGYVDKYVKM